MRKSKNIESQLHTPEDVAAKYTDAIAIDQPLYAWGFYFEEADKYKLGPHIYYAELLGSTMLGLMDIRDSKNKRVRERGFTVWNGFYNIQFWIAVPANLLTAPAMKIYDRIASAVPGYYGSDYSSNLILQLTPAFRYQFGEISSYSDSASAGQTKTLEAEGRTIDVHYRQYFTVSSKKSEMYGGLNKLPIQNDKIIE